MQEGSNPQIFVNQIVQSIAGSWTFIVVFYFPQTCDSLLFSFALTCLVYMLENAWLDS